MKILATTLVTIAVMGICSVAFAQGAWERNEMTRDPSFSENYSFEIQNKGRLVGDCMIFVKRDGSGVLVFANHYGWKGMTVSHRICVAAATKTTEEHIAMVTYDGSKNPLYSDDVYLINRGKYPVPKRGFFVFEEFTPFIPQLPKEVQKKFFGYRGIGNE